MVDSKADVAVVGADVVDPVGDDFGQFLVLEIVGVDLESADPAGYSRCRRS
jgi:hypothetical protein